MILVKILKSNIDQEMKHKNIEYCLVKTDEKVLFKITVDIINNNKN